MVLTAVGARQAGKRAAAGVIDRDVDAVPAVGGQEVDTERTLQDLRVVVDVVTRLADSLRGLYVELDAYGVVDCPVNIETNGVVLDLLDVRVNDRVGGSVRLQRR